MSTALATTALVISMNAAELAKETACKMQLVTYNAAGATIQQMKEYAGCVTLLYPNEVTSTELLVTKLAVLLLLIGTGLGIYFKYDKRLGVESIVTGAFVGLIAALSMIMATGFLIAAVRFLFS